MNKPPVNSLNLEFLEEINTLLNKLQKDKVRGMILTSVRIFFKYLPKCIFNQLFYINIL